MTEVVNKRRSKFNSVEVDLVHSNVGQEVIEITSDKLKLIFNDHIQCLSSRKEWHTPFSILVTIVLVLCTTSFKDFLGFKGDTWAAVFIITAGLSTIWLFNAILKLRKAATVEDFLNAAKNKA